MVGTAESRDALAKIEDAGVTEAMAQEAETIFEHERITGEQALARVSARVEPKTLEAFHLTALEGRSGAEVGAKLGMTAAAVFRARHRVARMLEEEFRIIEKGLGDIP